MPFLSIGPIDLRYYSGQNWSNLEIAWVTARKAGYASRETAIRIGGKSEHILEVFGEENPADTLTVNGTTYTGRVAAGADGVVHSLSAAQVAARAQRIAAMRRGLLEAQRAAVLITGDIDAPGSAA